MVYFRDVAVELINSVTASEDQQYKYITPEMSRNIRSALSCGEDHQLYNIQSISSYYEIRVFIRMFESRLRRSMLKNGGRWSLDLVAKT